MSDRSKDMALLSEKDADWIRGYGNAIHDMKLFFDNINCHMGDYLTNRCCKTIASGIHIKEYDKQAEKSCVEEIFVALRSRLTDSMELQWNDVTVSLINLRKFEKGMSKESKPGAGDNIRWSLEALINEYEGGLDTWLDTIGASREDFKAFTDAGSSFVNRKRESEK